MAIIHTQYVGQTADTVRSRVWVHEQQIAHKEFRMLGIRHSSIY